MRHEIQKRARSSRGFSLIEMLIVVAIIAVVSAIVVPQLVPTKRGTQEQLVIDKLASVAQLQEAFRVDLGYKRYGRLSEMRQAQTGAGPLMNQTLAPADTNGNPVANQGWIIRESSTPTDTTLRSSFAIEAVPEAGNPSTNRYCVHEDGEVRRATGGAQCGRTSTPVRQ